ncbi:MAG: hypothetical protein IPQ04_12580 [Saprospiraceae bacterium]|nr:hypothetical protein [Saprospiraceae bacterium]
MKKLFTCMIALGFSAIGYSQESESVNRKLLNRSPSPKGFQIHAASNAD